MKVKIQGLEPIEVDNKFYINPDGWFKRTWCFSHQWSNVCCNHYVIEADTIGDAIDTLLDSDFGKNFNQFCFCHHGDPLNLKGGLFTKL